MVILQYRMTTSEPEEYLRWLATAGNVQVAASRERGLVAHRVLQNQEDPHEILVIDEWEGEPQELEYMIWELAEDGYWTIVTAGPCVTRFQEVDLAHIAAGGASAEVEE